MSDLPRVVHVSDNVPGAVYVGRENRRKGLKASPFANPYKIGVPSSSVKTADGNTIATADMMSRDTVIARYRSRLLGSSKLLAQIPELRNAPALACWCRKDGEERTPDNLCHADVLVELLAKYSDEELREMLR